MAKKSKKVGTTSGTGGRAAILAAVADLLVERGPGAVSVDNILAVSGLSKGGFFYHFKTKQDAILAAFEDQVGRVERLVQANVQEAEAQHGGLLKSYVRTVLHPKLASEHHLLESTVRTLVALLNEDPRMMPAIGNIFRASAASLAFEKVPWETQVVICETVEGIWLARALGISHYTAAECQRIAEHLIKMASDPMQDTERASKGKRQAVTPKTVKGKRRT